MGRRGGLRTLVRRWITSSGPTERASYTVAPGLIVFGDVTVLPCTRDGASPTGYSFGAFDRDGAHLPVFDHPWCASRAYELDASPLAGQVIYGGMLMNHFGHFLLEAMSRLWFIRAHPELPILWHKIDLPVPHVAWNRWLPDTWRLLGLDTRQHVEIGRSMRVESVIVPAHGFSRPAGFYPGQVESLAVIPPPRGPFGGRVWLSRTGLPAHFGRLLGEEAIERILADRGWLILRPETLPVTDQANIFARADVVSGFISSAFHAVLLTVAPRARLRIVRRPAIPTDNYDLVAAAKGLNQAFLDVPLNATGRLNAWTTFEVLDPEAAARTIMAATESEIGSAVS